MSGPIASKLCQVELHSHLVLHYVRPFCSLYSYVDDTQLFLSYHTYETVLMVRLMDADLECQIVGKILQL